MTCHLLFDKKEIFYERKLQIVTEPRFSLDYFYQRPQKFDEAFEVFEQMVADSSENCSALYQIGRALKI
jgi:hypothetical protein